MSSKREHVRRWLLAQWKGTSIEVGNKALHERVCQLCPCVVIYPCVVNCPCVVNHPCAINHSCALNYSFVVSCPCIVNYPCAINYFCVFNNPCVRNCLCVVNCSCVTNHPCVVIFSCVIIHPCVIKRPCLVNRPCVVNYPFVVNHPCVANTGEAYWLWLRSARTVYRHRTWPYIWWYPCQKYRIYTPEVPYIYMVLANPNWERCPVCSSTLRGSLVSRVGQNRIYIYIYIYIYIRRMCDIRSSPRGQFLRLYIYASYT
jgi:hypothetical protein